MPRRVLPQNYTVTSIILSPSAGGSSRGIGCTIHFGMYAEDYTINYMEVCGVAASGGGDSGQSRQQFPMSLLYTRVGVELRGSWRAATVVGLGGAGLVVQYEADGSTELMSLGAATTRIRRFEGAGHSDEQTELQYPAPEALDRGPAPLGSNYQDDHYAHYPDCDVAGCRARGYGLFDTIYDCRGSCSKHFCGFHVPIHMPTGVCGPCRNRP
jgi:hypothetical protein